MIFFKILWDKKKCQKKIDPTKKLKTLHSSTILDLIGSK